MAIRRLKLSKAGLLGLMSAMLAGAATAAPSAIGRFNDWTVYEDTVGGTRICFAATEATDKAPKSASHGDVWFYVTNWADGAARGQPSLKVGYELRADLPAKARIGRSVWPMFNNQNEAFAEDEDDPRIVRALKRGSELRVEAVSARNTAVAYHFSLKGSSKAIDRAAAACR